MADFGKLAFTSKFRYEQVQLHGSMPFSVTMAEFYKEFTITHNLGYTPFFRLWYDFGDGRVFELFAGPNSYNIAGNSAQVDNIYADGTKIVVAIDNFGSGPTVAGKIYWRIYQEQIA